MRLLLLVIGYLEKKEWVRHCESQETTLTEMAWTSGQPLARSTEATMQLTNRINIQFCLSGVIRIRRMSADAVVSAFKIILDGGCEPVFKGGEVLTGRICIELRSSIVINAVKLQLKGRASWLNDPIKKDNIEQVYFDQDFTLLERPPGKTEAGHFTWIGGFPYSLPFECPLPKGCPTSYEGPYAFIRYFIKATLVHEEVDGKTKEYYVKKAFSIVSPSNEHIVEGESFTVKDTVGYGKCCCKGKLMAELSLPKTGYLPGEMVTGSLKISNKYPKDMLQHVEVRLVDRVLCTGGGEKESTSPYRTLYFRKLEITESVRGYGKFENDDFYMLTIPSVCPTTKGDYFMNKELYILSPDVVADSPSAATAVQRKQPFIRVEYALQLSLGNIVLLEAPITVGELSTYDSKNVLKPFVAGPQPIEEVDETQKVAIGGPFMYTPVYSMKLHPSNEGFDKQGCTKAEKRSFERKELICRATSMSDESSDVGVVEVDVSPNISHWTDRAAHAFNSSTNRTGGDAESGGFAKSRKETTLVTEITKDVGRNVIRTTTKTKHLDGSESTMVQIHTATSSVIMED
ncbi:hypothetical protein RB195_024223 [Necator americanus]|uniref:Arrestin C-terminal-like domain-containing protein n=1 Tax=Necator americanus TaxID=51031 RepID=A0ABR1EPN9_NECAM